ncbi:MAG: RagB/SusD family nutrient uptake outer membrane protein [Bacteroidales bacterium]|nr:RagB/SusD family nutrient uptake outer membrane protein [Bacteroidales bacterium]
MTKKVLKYMSFLLPGIIFFGCESDFLDVTPQAAENSASFYLTQEHADQAVIAAYSLFNNIGTWDVNMMQRLGDIPSDDAEAGGEDVTDCPNLQAFNQLIPLTTEAIYEDVFGTMYRAIYFSNIAIEQIPAIKDKDPDADPALLDKRVAEAKFIRAINYFYLTKIFGGVPLVDHILGAEEYQQPRAEIKAIYELIEQDLKDAIAVLPERSGWGTEVGRASKGAAKALLGTLYLFESSYARNYGGSDARFDGMTERWDEALAVSEEVINSGEYELVGINGETFESWRGPETNGFRYIFTSDGDNSKEGVFEIQCIEEGLGWAAARGNAMAQWSGSRYYLDEEGSPARTATWGFGVPTQELYNAFEPGDPRLKVTMTREGDTDSIQIGNSLWVPYCFDHCITKVYARKWEASSAEFLDVGAPWHGAPQNIRLIRFAEVYLNAAEAALMDGQDAKALQYVNKVRERARMCGGPGNTVPAALTSVTMEDIMQERRFELSSEGKRFFDIVRWGIAADLLNAVPTYDGYPREFIVGKHEFQPIPQREVTLSNDVLVQYEGW